MFCVHFQHYSLWRPTACPRERIMAGISPEYETREILDIAVTAGDGRLYNPATGETGAFGRPDDGIHRQLSRPLVFYDAAFADVFPARLKLRQ